MTHPETVADREPEFLTAPKRIGLILPSSNTAMEEEFPKMLPPADFVVHSARARLTDVTPEALIKMETTAETSAQQLADAGVDVILYTCSSKLGHDKDQALATKLEGISGVHTIAYTQGVVEALRAVGAKSIAMVTPYPAAVDVLEARFYGGAGFNIVNLQSLHIIDNRRAGLVSPDYWYDFVKDADRPEADAVYISCTQVRSIEVIARLEHELRKPVVAANTASLWFVLREIGHHEPIEGFGQLLRSLS